MVEDSVFRGVIVFFDKLGIYDVVLPFLLIFTIVFAILEKTKVLGTEEIEGKKYTKKNLDAMLAFVTSFLVVASTKLVAVINEAIANTVLLLLLVILFLLLVGSFFKEGEDVALEKSWRTFFMTAMFIGIVLIFLNALNWLEPFWDYLTDHWETQWVASLILLIFIVLFIYFITKTPGSPAKSEEKSEE
ncbi:hypothetical protein GOV06_05100 [Candidatus Woesearchaeota archaeon]|nr:hypothetical protein [Candidatus Woesearchaeota archaeon]